MSGQKPCSLTSYATIGRAAVIRASLAQNLAGAADNGSGAGGPTGAELGVDESKALVYRDRAGMYIDHDGNFTLLEHEGATRLTEITGKGTKRSRKEA